MDDITKRILDELRPGESISLGELERQRRELQRRAELQARTADDERHVTMMLKAADYDALIARAEATLAEHNAAVGRAFNAEVENQRQTKANAALAARVAELEAAADRHAQDYDALHHDYQEMRRNWEGTADIGAARYLAEQRVAELTAALAAQQWRPVTEAPPAPDAYLVYRAAPPQNEPWRYDFAVWEDDGWDTEGFTHYRPLPPAPDAQEPTP